MSDHRYGASLDCGQGRKRTRMTYGREEVVDYHIIFPHREWSRYLIVDQKRLERWDRIITSLGVFGTAPARPACTSFLLYSGQRGVSTPFQSHRLDYSHGGEVF